MTKVLLFIGVFFARSLIHGKQYLAGAQPLLHYRHFLFECLFLGISLFLFKFLENEEHRQPLIILLLSLNFLLIFIPLYCTIIVYLKSKAAFADNVKRLIWQARKNSQLNRFQKNRNLISFHSSESKNTPELIFYFGEALWAVGEVEDGIGYIEDALMDGFAGVEPSRILFIFESYYLTNETAKNEGVEFCIIFLSKFDRSQLSEAIEKLLEKCEEK